MCHSALRVIEAATKVLPGPSALESITTYGYDGDGCSGCWLHLWSTNRWSSLRSGDDRCIQFRCLFAFFFWCHRCWCGLNMLEVIFRDRVVDTGCSSVVSKQSLDANRCPPFLHSGTHLNGSAVLSCAMWQTTQHGFASPQAGANIIDSREEKQCRCL
eukprot:3820930-Amphidinium_carterae.1